jgi:hypothetical protein
MTARVAALFTLCMLTTGAAMVRDVEVTPASELRAASRLARDGDLQADWNKKTTDPLAPEWGLAEAWGWLGGAYLMQGDSQKAITVTEWLEAAWAAIRSVLEYGNAWSHALLFSRGETHACL